MIEEYILNGSISYGELAAIIVTLGLCLIVAIGDIIAIGLYLGRNRREK